MKYGFIYITTNILTGRKYIGMKKYCKGWENYFGSSKWLLNDIVKFGQHNFTREIIEECKNLRELQEREIFYLKANDVLNNKSNFYNLSIPHIEFRKKRNTNCNKGKTWEEIYGKEYAEKKRLMLSERTKNKTWEELYGKKCAEKMRKIYSRPRTLEMRQNMSNGRKGIIFSEEHRKNLSKARLNYVRSYSCKNW